MRFFSLLDFQHWVLAFFLGLTALVLVYLGFGTYSRRRAEGPHTLPKGPATSAAERAEEPEENPIPVLLVVVYVGIVVSAITYMVIVGIRGVAF